MSTSPNPKLRVASDGPPPARPAGSRRWGRLLAAGLFTVVGPVIAGRGLARRHDEAAVAAETRYLAVPTVSVVRPRRASDVVDLSLPATVQAYTDAPIYARTSGYLKRWHFDIGSHVRAGELLAEIEAPEVDEQLRQARSQLATAQANYRLAATTDTRYQRLLERHGVSSQDADNAHGNFAAQRATVQAAVANVRRLEDLQRFEKVYAPFDGIVTVRNTDVGALIDAGSSGGPTRELFHVADTRTMRVYVNVPETYSRSVKLGMTAVLTLTEFPGRRFQAVLRRTTQAIDPSSRTLLAEFSVPNPDGDLMPGSYAVIHLGASRGAPTYLLPVAALLFRSEGLRVATVDAGGKAVLRPIETGRDLGNEVEVLSGLGDDEAVIVDPPDSIAPGELVRVSRQAG
ncbi:efflux RND transporter periplasmic adaptor subunit [Anaeromyxobacter oryzae]|uniref:RND transporter MFP subunit n=1 Tax=Anaeromyxobacter oryzae TaxID=2918170 RepID=A0ABM7X1A6_9BACT|nr:efflux RND transporter periplasmic adaptor subunit [Anaeromyxobacter oryzae]BDG05586.1 RND transporter MFP subunit [Anaeromyxobacter oryzae]